MSNQNHGTAKHKRHKLTFDPNTKSLSGFLGQLNECAERAFGDNAQHMIVSSLYVKLPPLLKRSLNLAYLENGTYDRNWYTSRKRVRTHWFRKRWGANNTLDDGSTPK